MLRKRTNSSSDDKTVQSTVPLGRGNLGSRVACPELTDQPGAQFGPQFGARLCKSEAIYFCQSEYQGAIQLKATIIPYDSKTFISDLQASQQDDDLDSRALGSSSISPHSNQIVFTLYGSDSIARIDVIMSVTGIQGLCFHIERVGGCVVETVGHTEARGSSLGITNLVGQGRILGLLLGSDVSALSLFSPFLPLSFLGQILLDRIVRLIFWT
jgi:hypothetical protein